MEAGTHVWLRSPNSTWGWVPAVITKKEHTTLTKENIPMVILTLRDDPSDDGGTASTWTSRSPSPILNSSPTSNPLEISMSINPSNSTVWRSRGPPMTVRPSSYYDQNSFEITITVDPEQLKLSDHDDIKLRNLPSQFQLSGRDTEAGVITSPSCINECGVVGGVDDLIGLTHLHEPAILHALRLRYDSDIIYTATGPILIAVNPFKPMDLYSSSVMERYRIQGESRGGGVPTTGLTPSKFKAHPRLSGNCTGLTPGKFKQSRFRRDTERLSPHPYQIADDAYRAMMRGLENAALVSRGGRMMQTNQSILVSGESGAGKTVTTKIVLNYFAMLSKKRAEEEGWRSPKSAKSSDEEDVSIEQQVLQSNPILESFGNARTIRNDNSSRFGKYIDITFSGYGKVSGASIETYLLEKVRLIHPGAGERNYHVFYQFLASATTQERKDFYLGNLIERDFCLLSQGGTYTRRDGVSDEEMHQEMLDAMITIGFTPEQIQSLMRLVVATLFLGNITFTAEPQTESCTLDSSHHSHSAATLLGIPHPSLVAALTSRQILAGYEILEKSLTIEEAIKSNEALIKACYGAAFDYIVEKINESIDDEHELLQQNRNAHFHLPQASIGVLDIFGFETFQHNNFEQLCINYTNEALQQQFNKYVFKLEQQEYEREGILWKFISFPDNQDVLDLIDQKHVGILSILDEQCIVPMSTDEKFTRYLYSKCDAHSRFTASSSQRVKHTFSIEHYAGPVEYGTEGWLEKNKDQLSVQCAELLSTSTFELLHELKRFVRIEDRNGRGTIANKSVGAQFSTQLRSLRCRIDETVPHYIRCLKPNDDLIPERFEPKNIVEQLRCGGVLEAVRVSRAGYPTRYPHDLFLGRYFILVKKMVEEEVGRGKLNREERLRILVDKIAYDVWEADHNMMASLVEAEKIRQALSPKFKSPLRSSNLPLMTPPPPPRTPPRSPQRIRTLAAESSARTPEHKKNKKTLKENDFDEAEIARPETKEEFLALDFSARCAVAGLQLGRTKVFIRREAFDRIEAMRSNFFFSAAITIQAVVRGKVWRRKYLAMREGVVKIQCLVRKTIAYHVTMRYRFILAVTRIQRAWRMAKLKLSIWYCFMKMKRASVTIQRAYRVYKRRKAREERRLYELEIWSAMKIQSFFRGRRTRQIYLHIVRSVVKFQSIVRGHQSRCRKPRDDRMVVESQPRKVEAIGTKGSYQSDPLSVEHASRALTPRIREPVTIVDLPPVPTPLDKTISQKSELFRHVKEQHWAMVENILDKHPELSEQVDPNTGELPLHVIAQHSGAWTLLIDMVLVLYPKALIHRDRMGALPIHHAAAHDNLAALEIIYSAYKEGINDVDLQGRLPIHVAAEFDAVDAVKFLLAKAPEGAYTMIHRPPNNSGGGLPLHVACRHYASIGVITALLAENFASAKRSDENGDLPLHLLLRCGEVVDQVVVKTLLTCFSAAVSRTDMNGDLPLAIALKHGCKPAVINTLLIQFPDAAGILNGEGHSPLHLAFENGADDRTVLGLLNHAPELATAMDKKTQTLPIQVATEHDASPFIVHNLLKRDMPIDLKEKVRAQLLPHHYSWNHIVSNTQDRYHMVVSKLLQQCTQPQVLALAHVEDPEGKIALASATQVCKHELRVMLRLFNTLEVVNQRPAYSNPISDTQIFYALRYEPPPQQSAAFTILHEDKRDDALNDYIEEWDDSSHYSNMSRSSAKSTISNRSQQSIDEKLRYIRKEKGQQVIAKLTSRSDVVERELKVRKEYHLSRHYVPAIISVHHTVQHAAYSEAMAEPGYCITMEGADTTAENLMLDMRKNGHAFPAKALKRIGISLLHMHEHGIVHGDFGTHNIGKFGSRWKLLGVGGSVAIGDKTDTNRGFYHPPEAIVVESKRASLGKKSFSAHVVSITAQPSFDIWAYGVVVYEAIAGVPLSPYACRGKRVMSSSEIAKIGRWDDHSLKKALKHVEDDGDAKDLIRQLLHADLNKRIGSMKQVMDHPFFNKEGGNAKKSRGGGNSINSPNSKRCMDKSPSNATASTASQSKSTHTRKKSSDLSQSKSTNTAASSITNSLSPTESKVSMKSSNGDRNTPFDEENVINGVKKPNNGVYSGETATEVSSISAGNKKSHKSFSGLKNTLKSRRRLGRERQSGTIQSSLN